MVSQLLKGTIIRKYLFRSVIGLVSQHALSNMVTQLWALFDDNGNWLFGEPSYSICSSLTWASLSILAWWGKAAPRLAITNWITRITSPSVICQETKFTHRVQIESLFYLVKPDSNSMDVSGCTLLLKTWVLQLYSTFHTLISALVARIRRLIF